MTGAYAPAEFAVGAPDDPLRGAVPPDRARPLRDGAMRHMYDFGTTSEQLAWIKVAASHHAQHNPHALPPEVVTVEDVLASPVVADPLHRLDCCIVSDGGGAFVVTSPEIAPSSASLTFASPARRGGKGLRRQPAT